MKYNLTIVVALLFILMGGITACSFGSDSEATVETNATAPQVTTPQATTSQVATPSAETSPTPQAEPSATPQVKPSATPVAEVAPEVKAEALVNLNLRQGPGTNYSVVGSLPEKSEITVIGQNADGSWLMADTESGEEVWLSGDPELVKVDSELRSGLPVVEAPPPAYDAGNPQVNEVLNMIPLVIHHGGTFTCASHAGINNILSIQEGNVIGPHANDFVWSDKGNVLFKYTNGTFVLIRDDPIARFDDGAESLPLAQALKMFETGEIVWNGTFGQSPARGVTGCDESAP
jgi:hypothetical protein